MQNEIQILPLRKYELTFADYNDDVIENDVFTGDKYIQDENSLIFYRTGNVIRQYFYPLPRKIVVTPVDDSEVSK